MDTEEAIIAKLAHEFPLIESELLHLIFADSVEVSDNIQTAEKTARVTLAQLNLEAEFQGTDWKEQDTKDLEKALKDVGEEFSSIEFRDGTLTYKGADDINVLDELEPSDDDDVWVDYSEGESKRGGKSKHKAARLAEKEHKQRKGHFMSRKEQHQQAKIKHVSHIFPNISSHKIQVTLEQCDWNVERATEELLSFEALQEVRREEQLEQHLAKIHLKNSSDKSLGNKQEEDLKSFLSKDIEYLEKIYKLSSKDAWACLKRNDFTITKAIHELDTANPTAWKTVPVLAPKLPSETISYASIASNSNSKPAPNLPKLSRRELEHKLVESQAKQAESYAKAREAYRKSKSNPLFRSVAGVYAEQAQVHSAEKHVALESHFHNVVASQTTSHSIDLHTLPLAFAMQAASEKLHKWWTQEQSRISQGGRAKPFPLKIISGAGRHSNANIPKIKNGIRKKLTEEKWKFTEHESFFMVLGTRWVMTKNTVLYYVIFNILLSSPPIKKHTLQYIFLRVVV